MTDMQIENSPSGGGFLKSARFSSAMSLLATAALFLGGCKQEIKSVREKISELPATTPSAIVQNPVEWEGKRVKIELDPRFRSDRSEIEWWGEVNYLNQDIRYSLTDQDGKTIECIMNDSIALYGGRTTDADNPASSYYLRDSTCVVAGTLRQYSNSEDLYLDYEMSMYSE